MQTVADEAGHGDAAVLDLGVAQPADGVLVAAAPEVRVGEAEGVVEADHRVQLDGERLKVGLGLLDLDRGAGGRRSDERRGDREAGESDGELLRWGLTMSFLSAMMRARMVCAAIASLCVCPYRAWFLQQTGQVQARAVRHDGT